MSPGPRSRKGAPGILDVAQRAGVSGATVSRAFTHPDVLRPDTRARVLQAARDLGYIRDRLAGGLHSRRSGSVGLVVPTIDNAIFSELIEAFSNRLGEHERTMLIASHDYDPKREVAIVRSLLERRIDGLALIGRGHDPVALQMLSMRDVPVVTLWNADGVPGLPSIGADNREAGRRVAQHLVELGHRDIALLFPDTHSNDRAGDRLSGVMQILDEAGIDVPATRQLDCPYDMLAAKTVCLKLLSGASRPSAVIGGNDIISLGAMHAARRLGIDVPEQLSVVGIGDFKGSAAMEPGLTTVRLPARRIGQMAADTLIGRIHASDVGAPAATVFDCPLVQRASTGPPCPS